MTASVFLKDDRCNHVGLASKQKCKEAELIRLGQIIQITGSDSVNAGARKRNIILQTGFHKIKFFLR